MEVHFEPQSGEPPFSIELGYFDTVLEIKEKILKYQAIPIHKQTLVFNGLVLQDEHDIEKCVILQDSRIQLIVSSDEPQVDTEQSSSSEKIHLKINVATSMTPLSLYMDVNDTVLRLKEKIHETETIPVDWLAVQSSGAELQDHLSLRDCELVDSAEVDVNIRPPPVTMGSKVDVNIRPPPVTMGIPVDWLAAQSSGAELQDHLCLRDCELMDGAEVDVNIRQPPVTTESKVDVNIRPLPVTTGSKVDVNIRPPPVTTGSKVDVNIRPPPVTTGSKVDVNIRPLTVTTGPKKLKLWVLSKCGTKKVPVEVNPSDNVSELRKELENLPQRYHFPLPEDGYFFIYKQDVMDDDRSFRWHRVGQGDIIEVFPGRVTSA